MIAPRNPHALKEWAITVRALRRGEQILLLRKGGIHEQRNGFRVEHREFFLFPTTLHQAVQSLHPVFQADLQKLTLPAGNSIRFDTYALVRETIQIQDLKLLRPLDGLHTLNWETVAQRFHYRNRSGLHLLLLQVYALPSAHELENAERYDGCVSWVELEQQLPTAGAKCVLSSDEFESKAKEICRLLGQHAV